jgi:hypothetical protein
MGEMASVGRATMENRQRRCTLTRQQQFIGLGVVVAVAVGLGYAAWRLYSPSQITVCELSGRPIDANMRTIAYLGKNRKILCCPTCALSAAAQTHLPLHFERLTDYETSRPLRPEDAFAVEGSDAIPCERAHGTMTTEMLNQDGQPVPIVFDRCSPSILAFASRASAERFAAGHGGRVGTFLEIIARPLPSPSH